MAAMAHTPPPLILASSSPRRRALLEGVGLAFTVASPNVDERRRGAESPRAYVLRLARAKADAIGAGAHTAVLAADTTVAVDGMVLGKPRSPAEAARMLRKLSGRAHQVFTGVAARRGAELAARAEVTRVWFKPLTRTEIAWYVGTAEPYDKAGGYGIQGLASAFIPRIAGSYANVVGLPVATALALLGEVGHPLPWSAR